MHGRSKRKEGAEEDEMYIEREKQGDKRRGGPKSKAMYVYDK